MKHVAAIYSYSKTRGLFAGVSLEGSVICTRSDANEKLYGERYTAKQLLNGTVPPPLEADALYRALNSKFRSFGTMGTMFQRIVEREPPKIFRNTTISAPGTLRIPPLRRNIGYHSSPCLIGPPPTTAPGHDVLPSVTNNGYNNYTYIAPSAPLPSDSPTNIQYNKPFQPDSPIPQHASNLLKPDNPVPQHVKTLLKPDSPFPEHVNKPHEISPVIHNNSVTNMSTSSLGSEKTIYNESILPPLFDGQRMSFPSERKQTLTPPYNDQRMSFTKSSVPPPLFEGQQINFIREINNSPPAPPNPSFKPQKARAIYAYVGEQEGDLSFQPGDVILITEKTNDNNSWWTGNFQGQSGSVNVLIFMLCTIIIYFINLDFIVPIKLCRITLITTTISFILSLINNFNFYVFLRFGSLIKKKSGTEHWSRHTLISETIMLKNFHMSISLFYVRNSRHRKCLY